jgi:hypothetical protein
MKIVGGKLLIALITQELMVWFLGESDWDIEEISKYLRNNY